MRKDFLTKLKYYTSVLLFFSYVAFLLWRLFFYAYGDYTRSYNPEAQINLIPFQTIYRYFIYYDYFTFEIWFINLFGNIIAFMPLGYLLPLVYKKALNAKYIVFVSLVSSLVVEVLQLLTRLGSFDIDDILLNTVGGILGYIVLKLQTAVIYHLKDRS